MLIARHSVNLPDAAVPEWLQLLPAGTFKGADGRGPYHVDDAAEVIRASMTENGGKLAIDENHAIDHALTTGQPSPARGWIVELQSRADDGIWGRVEWTDAGAKIMADKQYRGLSPVFTHTKDLRVLALHRAALTNAPNLDLVSLHSQETFMDLAALRAALGLPETASEDTILTAVRSNAAAIATHSSQVSAIATAAGVAPATSPDGIVLAVQTLRGAVGEGATVVALQAQIADLNTKLNVVGESQRRTAAEAFIDGAVKAGKPILSVRDKLIARHMVAAAEVEDLVNGMPSINTGGVDQNKPANHAQQPDATAELTETDRIIARHMGLDPAKMAEHKKQIKGGKA